MTPKRLARSLAPFLVPVLMQAVLQTVVTKAWPSGWERMNELPTVWAMVVILGPSLLVGTWLLARVFRWYAAPLALVYVPAMVVVLSWIALGVAGVCERDNYLPQRSSCIMAALLKAPPPPAGNPATRKVVKKGKTRKEKQ